MIDIQTLIYYILLFGILMLPGYLLGKARKGELSGASVILSDVAMPFLVLSKLLETDVRSLSILEILLSCLFPVILCFGLWGISAVLFKNADEKKKRAEKFCAIFPNCGFLGIPLAAALFPTDPKICVLIALFNIVSTFLLLTVGVYILSGNNKQVSEKAVLYRPITLAMVGGVIISFFGLSKHLAWLATSSEMLAGLTTPLAMLVLGAELSKIRLKELCFCRMIYRVSFLRLLVSPLLALVLLVLLKIFFGDAVGLQLCAALMISTGVSTAATAPAMAGQYGSDGKHAAVLTFGTTLLCAISLPLVWLLFDYVFTHCL